MKNHNIHAKKWLGVMLLTIIIVSGCVTPEAEKLVTLQPTTITTAIPTSIATTVSPSMATVAPTATSKIPLCDFSENFAATTAVTSTLYAYDFSEPEVVLHYDNSPLQVLEWVDPQQLLITYLISSTHERIELFNVKSGQAQNYGERYSLSTTPTWLSSTHTIAFVDRVDKQWRLYTTSLAAPARAMIMKELASPHITTSPDGKHIFFFPQTSENQYQILDTTLKEEQSAIFNFPVLSMPVPTLHASPYLSSWHPDGEHIAFYNNGGFYLITLSTHQVCEIRFGDGEGYAKPWVVEAKWSPNGRYLAALTTVGEAPVDMIDLALLDMATGELRHFNFGYQYLYTLAWHPNSHELLTMVDVAFDDLTKANQYGVYIVDVTTGEARRILAEHIFMFAGVYGAAWSPTGRGLAIACPTVDATQGLITAGRVCMVKVEVQP